MTWKALEQLVVTKVTILSFFLPTDVIDVITLPVLYNCLYICIYIYMYVFIYMYAYIPDHSPDDCNKRSLKLWRKLLFIPISRYALYIYSVYIVYILYIYIMYICITYILYIFIVFQYMFLAFTASSVLAIRRTSLLWS